MATGPVSAVQVGSYFVGQYYQVLQRQPELVHQFYNDVSSMVRVDGESTLTADTILKIHTVIMSLNFITTEIQTINSLHSWDGGVLVMVSGHVRTSDYNGQRKFMQSFFLAPQEKGFFVLNDIFHFLEDEFILQDYAAPQLSENKSESLLGVSNSLPEAQVSDYGLEEEAIDYVQSLHVEDDLGNDYGFEEQHQLQYSEQRSVMYESPEQSSAAEHVGLLSNGQSLHSAIINEVHEEEPQKKTYASILRVAKGQHVASTASQPSVSQSVQPASEYDSRPHPAVKQLHAEALYVSETKDASAEDYSGLEDDGELKSVYVRNLPASVTSTQLEQEFKRFGTIIHDGIFIRNRPDIGVCYAFVEYESMASVHAALQASPIELDGKQIYVEERRANALGAFRGGRRGGRGRGGYSSDAPRGGRFVGRGSARGGYQEGGDYNRQKSNGYNPRGY
uniref:G3BP-like protein n=1 Tax=Kalanchoe fedtschenkoi TaxID=63787 RepID=A0A7N0U916_KALFE